MILALLAMAPDVSGATNNATIPVVDSVAVTETAEGRCQTGHSSPAVSAAHRADWSVSNYDSSAQTIKVYENGSRVYSGTDAAGSYTKTVTGYVVSGPLDQWTGFWVYRVDVIDNVSGAVVATKTATTFVRQYGHCDPEGAV